MLIKYCKQLTLKSKAFAVLQLLILFQLHFMCQDIKSRNCHRKDQMLPFFVLEFTKDIFHLLFFFYNIVHTPYRFPTSIAWPQSCCLDKRTSFVRSDEHQFRHLTSNFQFIWHCQFCLPKMTS